MKHSILAPCRPIDASSRRIVSIAQCRCTCRAKSGVAARAPSTRARQARERPQAVVHDPPGRPEFARNYDGLPEKSGVDALIHALLRSCRRVQRYPDELHKPAAVNLSRKLDEACKADTAGHVWTLAAMLARLRGDYGKAVRCSQNAVQICLSDEQRHAQASSPKSHRDQEWLSSPWIELGLAHRQIKNYRESLAAFDMGKDFDDPEAYYQSAIVRRELCAPTGYGQGYDLEWLQDMTKAAATGHVQAMVELATFYAYGPVLGTQEAVEPEGSLLTSAIRRLALREQYHGSTRNIEHFAAFARDTSERMQLAMSWLDVAIEYGYLRASELKARLLMLGGERPSRCHRVTKSAKSSVSDVQVAKTCLENVRQAQRDLEAADAANPGSRAMNSYADVMRLNEADLMPGSDLIDRVRELTVILD